MLNSRAAEKGDNNLYQTVSTKTQGKNDIIHVNRLVKNFPSINPAEIHSRLTAHAKLNM